jgi:hypothetical protein
MSQPDTPALKTSDAAAHYVAGRMSEDEEQAFEVAMLGSPDLAADVDVRQRIKAGLRHLERRGELQALLDAPPRRRYLPVALAASVLLLVFGVAYWKFMGMRASAPGAALSASAGSTGAVSASYLLASTRFGTTEPTFETAAGSAPLQLRIVPESRRATSFRVSLARIADDGETPASEPVRLARGTTDFVEVFVDPSKLTSGRYRLRLMPEPAGVNEEYVFTLRIAP